MRACRAAPHQARLRHTQFARNSLVGEIIQRLRGREGGRPLVKHARQEIRRREEQCMRAREGRRGEDRDGGAEVRTSALGWLEPGGSVHGERANFTALVLGCIDAEFDNLNFHPNFQVCSRSKMIFALSHLFGANILAIFKLYILQNIFVRFREILHNFAHLKILRSNSYQF